MDLTLHIGTPKSGTTHLQAALAAGRQELRREGILYPGEQYLPKEGFNQQPAIYALGRRYIGWVSEDARSNAVRYFGQLCEEVSTHHQRVLISAESLAFFDTPEIDTLLDRLRVDHGRVSVVITARDLTRVFPSIWQQNVKNGAVQPLESYLTSVASLRGRPGVPLWTAFGLPGLVERWAGVVGIDRVTLVTASRDGRDLLWQRFAEATALPKELKRTGRTGTTLDHNISLSWSQAELLRHLNLVLQTKDYSRRREQVLRERLLRIWMSKDPGPSPRIGLPDQLRAAVETWAEQDVEQLAHSGVRVVGSLDDLLPTTPSDPVADSRAVVLDDIAHDLLDILEHKDPPVPRGKRQRGLRLRRLRYLRHFRPLRLFNRMAKLSGRSAPPDRRAAGEAVVDITSPKPKPAPADASQP